MLNFLWIIGACHIHQVRSIFCDGFVVAQLLDHWYIMLHSYKFHITVLDFAAAEPDIHNRE